MKLMLIMGIQGSGKSTHAKKLREKFGWVHISTGNMLREHMENKTPLGLEYEADYKKGIMASDDILFGMITNELSKYTLGETIVLDGFPRNIKQMEWLNALWKVDTCIELILPIELAKSRILSRGRADDNVDALDTRITNYIEKTLPVVNYYDSIDKVVGIHTDQEKDDAFKDIFLKAVLTKQEAEFVKNEL